MDTIERLYKCYEILSEAGDKISEHVEEYKEILKAIKGGSKEKRLASQFIAHFFKHFPDLADTAIDAQLDLCEDNDSQIRRQAIKDLPKLCLGPLDTIAKVSDTLAQLLVLEDPLELQQVNNSLQTIIKLNAKGALSGIFQQIHTGEEATRERCFKFIASKLLTMGPTIVTKEVEDYIIDEIKKILQDVTADEFHLCMSILGATKLGTTITGHAELVRLATEQAELNTSDNVGLDDEAVERFIQCATEALPYFSNTIKSTKFVTYVCDKILPINSWNVIALASQQEQVPLRLLKVFADMCTYTEALEQAPKRIDAVYKVLLTYMPLPQLINADVSTTASVPSFEFSHAECLLYALHTLGKKNPNSLAFIDDAEKLKDFRARLQYLARGTQGYIKKLEESLKGKTAEELKSQENVLKQTALKTTSNINILIRDLFHSPPIFKHEVLLSWVVTKKTKIGIKRHVPITFNNGKATENGTDEKKSKNATDQRIYSPPSGKYSAKVQNYGNNRDRQLNRARNGGGGFRNQHRRGYKKY